MVATILIMEDNEANIDLMAYLLESAGYKVGSAGDGERGLEFVRRNLPDLVICDLQMPKINGYEVAQVLKGDSALKNIPLLAVTAFGMASDHVKAIAAGFDGYISKPIDPRTFVAQITDFLRVELRSTSITSYTTVSEPNNPSCVATGHTILVTDNLPAHLELARSLLEPNGYKVITASNAQDALKLAREEHPDLILSDVCMPVGSGYDLIRAVKADRQTNSIPFIFLSSTMTNEKDRQMGLALGAERYLFRPVESQALLDEIQRCLKIETEH